MLSSFSRPCFSVKIVYICGLRNCTRLPSFLLTQDEIYREKLKIKKVADELGETFDDMLAHY
jgi:hypothetical protein